MRMGVGTVKNAPPKSAASGKQLLLHPPTCCRKSRIWVSMACTCAGLLRFIACRARPLTAAQAAMACTAGFWMAAGPACSSRTCASHLCSTRDWRSMSSERNRSHSTACSGAAACSHRVVRLSPKGTGEKREDMSEAVRLPAMSRSSLSFSQRRCREAGR